jgi:voltage-gated potassium channel
VLRLIRLFRLLKVARYTRALHTMGRVFRDKREELAIAGFIASLIVLCASSSIYFLERDAQPEAFSSIPAAMWWAISTLTTVGYGDVYPVTPGGKLLGAITDVLGIAMFALPTGILAAGFAEELKRHRGDATRLCPHCGSEFTEISSERGQRRGRAAKPEV